MIGLVLLLSAIGAQSASGFERGQPLAVACGFPKFGNDGQFESMDRLVAFLPNGVTGGRVENVELRDPASLMRGSTFDQALFIPGMNSLAVHGRSFLLSISLNPPSSPTAPNAVLGPMDQDGGRTGRCFFLQGSEARGALDSNNQNGSLGGRN